MDEQLKIKTQEIIKLLKDNNIKFEIYEHEPIFSYDVAEKVSKELGFSGTESKSLFLKDKNKKNYIFFTIQGQKVDFKKLNKILGEKIAICESDEMNKIIDCYPGCVSPFGHNKDIPIITDSIVFEQGKIIFSPGVPTKTLIVSSEEFKKILQIIDNRVIYYN